MINIVVKDCFKQKEIINITENSVTIENCNNLNSTKNKSLILKASPIEYYYFYKEIINWKEFVKHLLKNPYLIERLIIIKLLPNTITTIDYKWCNIASVTLMEKIEIEHLFSWLSTLGGGYSALGENFTRCAQIAAKISLQQLALCLKLGDPNMQARCKLFYSISLIQQGNLRLAKHIIRKQYKFATSQNVEDTRLIKMCQGIWLKLQHSYRTRLLQLKVPS